MTYCPILKRAAKPLGKKHAPQLHGCWIECDRRRKPGQIAQARHAQRRCIHPEAQKLTILFRILFRLACAEEEESLLQARPR
jgi:hypothetical protein